MEKNILTKDKFKHGMRVVCEIFGRKITNAQLIKDATDKWYIAQNDIPAQKYKFSSSPWLTSRVLKDIGPYRYFFNAEDKNDVTDLRPHSGLIEDGVWEGCAVVDSHCHKRKILTICGEIIFVSDPFSHAAYNFFTLSELIELSYKILPDKYIASKNAAITVTKSEIAEKFGVSVEELEIAE